MVKVLGSLLILAGGVLVRRARLAERRQKSDTLSDLLTALRRMSEEIRMARTPLPPLLSSLGASCKSAGGLFCGAAAALASGEGLSTAWGRGVDGLPLSPRDRSVLSALGDDLHGDEESVCKAISLVIYELTKSREDLEKDRQAEEKRTTALCFSAAALLVILLI
ncbi:stage III sporulation protein AB [Oscillibacter sp.]|uniref:stage III sporulation protein AB n=1 Tax=Oscillibacter sp. TaxID=1945593 RepID=UPI002626E79B|nr:stage III sporulation protein AB [Oscillibacter sp.]MDD3346326.1 stage III sporulation protein AB [Oscillibacter sp.]